MYLIQTVQTSWRPQLPLPKEVVPPTTSDQRSFEMNRQSSAANHGSRKDTSSYQSAPQISSSGGGKKWSFGRLFRKKKEAETESSSEEDRKAGFVASPKYRKKDKKKRGSKLIGGGFDHIVVSPTRDNEFFLPFEPVPAVDTHQPAELHSRSTNSLDRRSKRDRKKSGVGGKDPQQRHTSSEEEMISLNSSTTFTKYRSDESLGSGGPGTNGNNGQSRRSRAARNERYYKRLSRDGEVSHGQVPVMYAPQPAQRWKTQPVPLSVYSGQISQMPPPAGQKARAQFPLPASQDQRMRNSTSLSHVAPHVPVTYGMIQPTRNLQNTVNDGKRSISYDSHIHLQNVKKPLPPPPPPRDPLRRVNVAGHDHRPISYAFDQSSAHAAPYAGMSGRCVSDDRIWSANAPMYQSGTSINNPPPSSQNRRFITRAERDAHPAKKSLPSGLDFRYVAEATPRSRKPIHLVNQEEEQPVKPPSPVIIRTTKSGLPDPAPHQSNPQLTTEYWHRGRDHNPRSEAVLNKPRSVSSSRVGELRSYNMPMYSEVSKPKAKRAPAEDADNVVSGSLLIKPSKDKQNNYVEIRNNANANKSNSMPNHYQRRDAPAPSRPKADSPTPNKYDEYVAEKRVRNILEHSLKVAPDPPQRKAATKPVAAAPEPDVIMRKKPTNLEDAINELEAIYKSLKLGDETLLDRAERRDIPTPTNFEKYAELHADEYLDDDDDEPAGEPDVVRDDFAFRNIKHANLAIKANEKQPPFGIPIGPIAPSPRSDYLHVTPDKDSHKVRTAPFKYPDVVCDDLAVRTLRKDPPGQKPHFLFPAGSLKKKRATRTQSANIYTLIQRNAAKPSGGDLHDYLELAKSLERAGSMSDIRKETDDIPSTLQLLRNLREQEQGSPKVLPFRHPSQGGAICSLPAVLVKADESQAAKPPVPLPRKSLSPDPEKTKMEDALNKIAKEAKESSEKLTRELMELRKEALITSSCPKAPSTSIERDLEQIEAVSEAAKRCRHILLDTLPPDTEEQQAQQPPRRLVTEDKLIKAIDQVSDAANKVCEKILNEIVTVQPPVVVQNAIEVKNRPKQELVMPSLIQKLDPSSARIGEIAERCMRQISELNDLPDYDNLHQQTALTMTACNATTPDTDRQKRSDAGLLIVPGTAQAPATAENEEEIDKIMKECEEQAKLTAKPEDPPTHSDEKTANTTSASSSSDCLKSSSPSAGPHMSSSITSFNPYSSSDYIKSPSSEFHAPSTDPIKTFSTTSYDVPSSSVTPNITNSPFSYTPSPPLNLTPVGSSGAEKGERSGSGSASQYNSSEELAMIFGIEKSSPATTTTGKQDDEVVVDCPVPRPVGVFRCSEPNKPGVVPNPAATTTSATNPELCESVLVCKLDPIEEVHETSSPCQISRLYVPSYASNVSILVTSVDEDDDDDDGGRESSRPVSSQQFDSLSSIDESSNPDSGNVSLSDFPTHGPVNASLELELAHNSRFEIAKSFVSEVTIGAEMDYFRGLFAQDEVSTSFSCEEDEDADDRPIDPKDQHSPGQLLHEVLSQVSRINAGTNRRQLLSQLENISECTKIVEDLSDRLSHPASRARGTHRVRFSDDCEDDDHEEDQSACLRSLELLGHHLSSSEESIPPLGEIFNVPLTDSENEHEERPSPVFSLNDSSFDFDKTQRSFEEECNTLKEALCRVIQSGLIGPCHKLELACRLEETPVVVSVVDVVDCVDSGVKNYLDDPQLRSLMSEDESLTQSSEVVSIVEVTDDSQLKGVFCESSIVEIQDESSEEVDRREVQDESFAEDNRREVQDESFAEDNKREVQDGSYKKAESKEIQDESSRENDKTEVRVGSSEEDDRRDDPNESFEKVYKSEIQNESSREAVKLQSVDDLFESDSSSPQADESEEERLRWSLQLESYTSPGAIVVSSDDESPPFEPQLIPCSGKAYLSPVSISLKIVNQVSKVSFVDCPENEELGSLTEVTDESFGWSQDVEVEASEIVLVDSEVESVERGSEIQVAHQAGLVESENESIRDSKLIENEIDTELVRASKAVLVKLREEFDADLGYQSTAVLVEFENEVSGNASALVEIDSEEGPMSEHNSSSSEASPPHPTSESEFEEEKQKFETRPSSSSSLTCKPPQETDKTQSLLKYRPSSSPSNIPSSESVPTTPTKSLSLLAQPRHEDRMTTLEHVLLACTIGIVTGNDFITMLAIIIGVLTIIAIVLL